MPSAVSGTAHIIRDRDDPCLGGEPGTPEPRTAPLLVPVTSATGAFVMGMDRCS
jgi:hypothetical protein